MNTIGTFATKKSGGVSPVTNGEQVYVMTGTGVLTAFDVAGTELWSRNIQTSYGRFGLNWGYASSPLLVARIASCSVCQNSIPKKISPSTQARR